MHPFLGGFDSGTARKDKKMNENVIEWQKDASVATLTLTQKRMKTRIRQLAEDRPDECSIIAENSDGSMCAHIPTAWIRINPSVQLTEAQRQARAEQLRRNVS